MSGGLRRLQGEEASVAGALGIMCDAIARYKELCEGAYAGAVALLLTAPGRHL